MKSQLTNEIVDQRLIVRNIKRCSGSGYVKGNIKAISFKANSLKKDGSIEDFEKIIEYIKGR